MTSYGIIYLDNYHCLRCGAASDTIKRMEIPFKAKGVQVIGFALLCVSCFGRVKVLRPISPRDILRPEQLDDMWNNDNSPYCEVLDSEYWEQIRRPAWQGG